MKHTILILFIILIMGCTRDKEPMVYDKVFTAVVTHSGGIDTVDYNHSNSYTGMYSGYIYFMVDDITIAAYSWNSKRGGMPVSYRVINIKYVK